MKTFLVNHYDFRKYDTEASKSSFSQTIVRLIIKFFIIYMGVMLFGFIYYQKIYSWLFNFAFNSYYRPYHRSYMMKIFQRYTWWEFFKFLADFSFGNWPDSLILADGVPALELVSSKFPQTIELLLYSSILISICGYFIGFLIAKAKWNRDFRFIDGFFRIFIGIFLYIPLIGIFLQYSLAIKMEIFPTIGLKTPGFVDPRRITGLRLIDCFLTGQFGLFYDTLDHLILPLFTLTSCGIGLILREFRNSLVQIFNHNSTQSNLARGAKLELKSIFHQKMRVSLTLRCFQSIFPSLISMVMIVERVFNLRGLGLLFIDAVNFRDPGVVVGVIQCLVVLIIFVNISITLFQYVINPAQHKKQQKLVSFDIPQRKPWFKG